MNKLKSCFYLGTSGWTYDHWKGIFYPASVPKKKWFEYFCEYFSTVEINASFYRIPTVKTSTSWLLRSPQNFRFAVKMSRLITHVKKLKNCQNELEWFFSSMEPLAPKILIYLIQLPPSLKYDPQRLKSFAAMLKKDAHYAVEFRDSSWYREETYDLLREFNFSFCIHDMGQLATGKIVTANPAYVRFHGFDAMYGGDYPDEILNQWAQWIAAQNRNGKTVLGYFNNDIGGYAVKNSLRLKELVIQYKRENS